MNLEIRNFVNKGEQWPRTRTFEWLTETVGYFSGSEQRNQILDRPIRHWKILWDWLTAAQRDKIVEIFNRAKGKFETFLLLDRKNVLESEGDFACTYTDWSYVAVGAETTTQLQKTYYKGTAEEWTEDKTRIQPSTIYPPTIKINGIAKTEGVHFTLDDDTGIINWAAGTSPNGALTAGQIITADYQFYFPVRFSDDIYNDIEHYKNYHSNDGIELLEVIE
jgi:uncharacterized protein (TIGR02217 family)